MPRIDRYDQLVAWQFASELADLVDTLIANGAAADNQSFRIQILKSSSKPPAQIAEGFARGLPKESAFYYRVARASTAPKRRITCNAGFIGATGVRQITRKA